MQTPPRRNSILIGALVATVLLSLAAIAVRGGPVTAQRGPTVPPTESNNPTLTPTTCPRGLACSTVTATATATSTATSTATVTATSTGTVTATATTTATVPAQTGATLGPGQAAAAAQEQEVAPGVVRLTPYFDIRTCQKVTVFAGASSQPGTPPAGQVDVLSSPDGQRDYGLIGTISLAAGGGVSPSGAGYTQAFTGVMSSFTNNLVSGVSTVVTLTPASPRLRFRLSNTGTAALGITVIVYCTV